MPTNPTDHSTNAATSTLHKETEPPLTYHIIMPRELREKDGHAPYADRSSNATTASDWANPKATAATWYARYATWHEWNSSANSSNSYNPTTSNKTSPATRTGQGKKEQ